MRAARLAGLLLLGACASGAHPSAHPAASASELLADEQAIFDAIMHMDWATLDALVDRDFVLSEAGEKDLRGRKQLYAHVAFGSSVITVTGDGLTAHLDGPDEAHVTGVRTTRWHIDGPDERYQDEFIDVFRRGADGRFRLVSESVRSLTPRMH